MLKKRVTLQDIATSGGWSVAAVSYALRDSPKIPPDTRTKIRAAAKQLGYCPDPTLSALSAYRRRESTPHRGNLAFVTTWGSPMTWSDKNGLLSGFRSFDLIYEGAVERAEMLGYTVEHFVLPAKDPKAGRALKAILLARGVLGVVGLAYPWLFSDLTIDLTHFAVAGIYSDGCDLKYSFLRNDNYHAARLAMRKILERGYRRPGLMIHKHIIDASEDEWSAGFVSMLPAFPDGAPNPLYLYAGPLAPSELHQWIQGNDLDVLILGSSGWLLPHLRKLGYRVPKDLGFCGLDLIEPDGKVTGFNQNPGELGRNAVSVLHSLLLTSQLGLRPFGTSIQLAPDWIEGTTLPMRAGENPPVLS